MHRQDLQENHEQQLQKQCIVNKQANHTIKANLNRKFTRSGVLTREFSLITSTTPLPPLHLIQHDLACPAADAHSDDHFKNSPALQQNSPNNCRILFQVAKSPEKTTIKATPSETSDNWFKFLTVIGKWSHLSRSKPCFGNFRSVATTDHIDKHHGTRKRAQNDRICDLWQC
jgi:hypothetical protein